MMKPTVFQMNYTDVHKILIESSKGYMQIREYQANVSLLKSAHNKTPP